MFLRRENLVLDQQNPSIGPPASGVKRRWADRARKQQQAMPSDISHQAAPQPSSAALQGA
jgi:hypothetical protein